MTDPEPVQPVRAESIHPTSREWVHRIRAGDEAAFEALFEAYFPALCDFAQSYVGDPDAAEDLVQSVFLRVWQIRADWQPDGVAAYLFAACRNRALSHLRHEHIAGRLTDDRAASAKAPTGPDEDAQATELADALRRAVHRLPERRRMVVILRWEHHLSHAEIAQVLGITVKTVETQFGRAIAVLRKQLAAFRP